MDDNAILLSFVVGAIGFVCLAYGKRQGRIPQMIAGLVLLVYPYFVSSVAWIAAIAAAVIGLLVVAVRAGW